jgi:hypothetical protein
MPLPFDNEQTVGTCGECGGPVVVPIAWWSVIPPVPTCKECGATAKPNYGPVTPMNPPPRVSDRIEIDPDAPSSGIIFRTDSGTSCCV